jgi:hypothetical protein
MHRTEAAEINAAWHPKLLGSLLDVPVKQVVAIERLAGFVGKHQIIRRPELRILHPHPLHGSKNHAVPIEGHLALAGVRLDVIELIVVDTLVYDDAIAQDVFPPQGQSFTRTHGREYDQGNQ